MSGVHFMWAQFWASVDEVNMYSTGYNSEIIHFETMVVSYTLISSELSFK